MSSSETAVVVAGLVNIETTLRVDGFPVEYDPVRYPFHGVETTVSGVGFNVSKALTLLGHTVRFATLVGRDLGGRAVREALEEAGVSSDLLVDHAEQTPQSVILYEPSGRRQIHLDLKDVQTLEYPAEQFDEMLRNCALAVVCNINFARPLLSRARQAGVQVATDVHTLSSLDDDYNRDFMAAADILFLSDENLWDTPERVVRQIHERFGPEVVVIGLGARGAVLGLRGTSDIMYAPAVSTRPVVSTIGAGDALFASFVNEYARHGNPFRALRRAVVFASWKIGAASASDGFLTPAALDRLAASVNADGHHARSRTSPD